MRKNGNNSTNNKTSNGTCLALWIRSTISLAPPGCAVALSNEWEKSCESQRISVCEKGEIQRVKETEREWKWASMSASLLQLIVFVFDFLCSFAPVPIDRYTRRRQRQPTNRPNERDSCHFGCYCDNKNEIQIRTHTKRKIYANWIFIRIVYVNLNPFLVVDIVIFIVFPLVYYISKICMRSMSVCVCALYARRPLLTFVGASECGILRNLHRCEHTRATEAVSWAYGLDGLCARSIFYQATKSHSQYDTSINVRNQNNWNGNVYAPKSKRNGKQQRNIFFSQRHQSNRMTVCLNTEIKMKWNWKFAIVFECLLLLLFIHL